MSKNVNIKDLFSYEFYCELPGTSERIKFRPITTGQLKKLLVYENEKDKDIIDEILDSLITDCVISENFNIDDLYLLDRFYLMLQLRMKSKGEEYEITHKCPQCGKETFSVIDLNDLPVKPYDKNINHFVQCNDKVSIYVDFLKRGQEKKLSKIIQEQHGKIELDENGELDSKILGFYALKYIELSIGKIKLENGKIIELTDEQKEEVVDNLTEENIKSIREWFDENTFGVDFNINLTCVNGHTEKIEVPADKIFF
jgi:hypothetical protein